jgi:hypothetical protein
MDLARHTAVILASVVLAAGCEGGEDESPALDADAARETARFLPLLCTGGLPDEPTCPVTHVQLDEVGAAAGFHVVVQPLGSGVQLDHMVFNAGSTGLYLERPSIRFWPAGATEPSVDHVFDVTLNLAAGESAPLEGPVAFDGISADRMSIRFETIGHHRP